MVQFPALESEITESVQILDKYAHLLQPANDFYIQNIHHDILDLQGDKLESFVKFEFPVEIEEFIKDSQWLRPNNGYIEEFAELESSCTIGMNPKKRMEVKQMAGLVSRIAKSNEIDTVVELGSGQGYLSNTLSFQHGFNCLGFDSDQIQTKGAINNQKLIQKTRLGKEFGGYIKHVNSRVEANDTTLESLLSKASLDEFSAQTIDINPKGNYLLCGLHTCGDLASYLIQMFLNSSAKALVSIGCCYNLLSTTFPMSNYLQKMDYKLSKSRLNTASQSPNSWVNKSKSENMMVFKRMHWRCMLQVILSKMYDIEPGSCKFRVGKLKNLAFHGDFSNYCQHAFKSLKLDKSPSESLVSNVFNDYDHYFNRVIVYWTMRSILSKRIEELIINDRILYLREQGLTKVQVLPIFEKVESPRNMVLIAIKE